MSNFKSFSFKVKLGTLGDMQTEWWTEQDWENWKVYCDQLEKEGKLGEEVEYNYLYDPEIERKWWESMGVKVKEAPSVPPKESYIFLIFDVSNEENPNKEDIRKEEG